MRDEASAGVVVERARRDFRLLLSRAALSISQAGYNTLMDLMAAGCPALVVPFAEGSESEQTFRARLFAARGLVDMLEDRMLDAANLAAVAERTAARGRRQSVGPRIDMDGVARTVEVAERLVLEARRRRG
ncbi:MAG: glycosyltransferase [Hyphomicrobiaceae bacterium]